MSMVITNNVSALNTQRWLDVNNTAMGSSLQKLSSCFSGCCTRSWKDISRSTTCSAMNSLRTGTEAAAVAAALTSAVHMQ